MPADMTTQRTGHAGVVAGDLRGLLSRDHRRAWPILRPAGCRRLCRGARRERQGPAGGMPSWTNPRPAGQGAAALVAGLGVQADPVQPERAERLVQHRGGPRDQAAALVTAVDPLADLPAAGIAVDPQAHRSRQLPLARPPGPRSPPAVPCRPASYARLPRWTRVSERHRRRVRPRLPAGQPVGTGRQQVVVGVGERRDPRHEHDAVAEREAEHRGRNRGHVVLFATAAGAWLSRLANARTVRQFRSVPSTPRTLVK